MPAQPVEGRTQHEALRLLKHAIDTALKYPGRATIATAREIVEQYPVAIRSSHFRHNLGARRWTWLSDQGLDPAGSSADIAGMPAMKGTIEPEVIK